LSTADSLISIPDTTHVPQPLRAEQNIQAHEILFGVGAITALLASAAAIVGLTVGVLFLMNFVAGLVATATAAAVVAVGASQLAPLAFAGSSLLSNKPADKKSFIKVGPIACICSLA
jgi:hypothetical protein